MPYTQKGCCSPCRMKYGDSMNSIAEIIAAFSFWNRWYERRYMPSPARRMWTMSMRFSVPYADRNIAKNSASGCSSGMANPNSGLPLNVVWSHSGHSPFSMMYCLMKWYPGVSLFLQSPVFEFAKLRKGVARSKQTIMMPIMGRICLFILSSQCPAY